MESDRRTVIKKSMKLAAAAYVAPITMQLLMATRATAQSAVAPATCGTCVNFTIRNNFRVTPFTIQFQPCMGTGDITLDPDETSQTLYANIGTPLTIIPPTQTNYTVSTCGQVITIP